jgi:hypothetical protein
MHGPPPVPAPIPFPAAPHAPAPPPSVGRVVLYHPTEAEREGRGGGETYPALVTRVWSPTCVNLHVLADAGPAFFVTSVEQARGRAPQRAWSWPPRV